MGIIKKFFKCLTIVVLFFVGATLAYWAISPNQAPLWTGFGDVQGKKDFQRAKTLWDWLQLLLVPSLVAVGGWWLNKSLKNSERHIETDRQRQKALEDYFNCMTQLLLDKDLAGAANTGSKAKHEEARKIARIRTLALLRTLDGDRKGQVIQFLYESELIQKNPIVDLIGADLRHASLEGATLTAVELRGVYFNNACLIGAQLMNADLRGSDFSAADLRQSDMTNANVKQAHFKQAKVPGSTCDKTTHEGNEFEDAIIYK